MDTLDNETEEVLEPEIQIDSDTSEIPEHNENTDSNENSENVDIAPNNLEDSSESLDETTNESINIKTDDANTTNCLALTIQEDHKLVAVKNVFLKTIRMSWKVIVTTVTLTILKFLT